jgi:alpha-L-fucosidase 2
MLLQSHNGELHVLPALPPAWPGGRVAGLRGRGGYTVGAAWDGGQVKELSVTPDRAGTARVRSRLFTGTYELRDVTADAVVQPVKVEADLVEFAVQAGHVYRATGQGGGSGSVVEIGVNYWLVAQHSGKRADVNGGSTAGGTTLIQWSASSGLNQQFDFLDSGGGYYRIRARHSGLVLQVANSSSGTDVAQQADTNGVAQQWRVVDQGGGVVSLVNRQSGLAMDVWGASTADGARIAQYSFSGGGNQRFQLQRA